MDDIFLIICQIICQYCIKNSSQHESEIGELSQPEN